MGSWWFPRRSGRSKEPIALAEAVDGREKSRPPRSPYSLQYETIVAQGHERPTPSFGAPTLIWHVGIWPRRKTDLGEDCDPNDTAGESNSATAKRAFKRRRLAWIEEINAFLEALQGTSSARPGQPHPAVKAFKPIFPHELKREGAVGERGIYVTPLKVLERDTLSFTLWWADTTDADPVRNAIRVRVHAELNADYACFSFYMDIGQVWNEAHSAHSMRGARRSRLLQAAQEIPGSASSSSLPSRPAGRPRSICPHPGIPAERGWAQLG